MVCKPASQRPNGMHATLRHAPDPINKCHHIGASITRRDVLRYWAEGIEALHISSEAQRQPSNTTLIILRRRQPMARSNTAPAVTRHHSRSLQVNQLQRWMSNRPLPIRLAGLMQTRKEMCEPGLQSGQRGLCPFAGSEAEIL